MSSNTNVKWIAAALRILNLVAPTKWIFGVFPILSLNGRLTGRHHVERLAIDGQRSSPRNGLLFVSDHDIDNHRNDIAVAVTIFTDDGTCAVCDGHDDAAVEIVGHMELRELP
ncbi:hypothetical protein ACOSQ2_024707 [Xanthoceras sorbifolium]